MLDTVHFILTCVSVCVSYLRRLIIDCFKSDVVDDAFAVEAHSVAAEDSAFVGTVLKEAQKALDLKHEKLAKKNKRRFV